MKRFHYRRLRALTVASLMCVGCGSDPVALTLEDVAGAYEATSFVGGGYDVLAEGGNLTMTLGVDGSVSGSMFIPATAGGPFSADLAGTFVISGRNLTFSQSADTFVRDVTWTWDDGVLDGSWSGGGQTITVRLERT